MLPICSSTQIYSATAKNTAQVDSIPDFVITRKNSAETFADGATIWAMSYIDLELSSSETIQSVEVDFDSIGTLAPQMLGNQLRIFVTDGLKPATITAKFAEGDRKKVLYVGKPVNVQEGQILEGLTPGGVVTQGSNSIVKESLEVLTANDNKIVLTMGAAPKRDSTLTKVSITIFKRPSGSHVTSKSYPDDSSKGLATVTAENLPAGLYTARNLYEYTDEADNWIEDLNFEVKAPASKPFETSLSIFDSSVYISDELKGLVYVDHLNEIVSQELLVNGVVYAQANIAGTRSLFFKLSSIGITAPGIYKLIWRANLASTEPKVSDSAEVTITVLAIPVTDLLDTAFASPQDSSLWQNVIDDPNATIRQQIVASEAADMADAIANPGIPVNGFLVLPNLVADAKNSLNTWATEESGKTNPLSFSEWQEQQTDWSNEAENLEYKNTIARFPTSSINALLLAMNQATHPFGSLSRNNIGSDWSFVDKFAQSRKGDVPDSVVLADYARYKSYAASTSDRPIKSFESWIVG